ncbi:N-6 DNA methylase [Tsuneonella sp. YG55]|uniref:site-specific DNA-methyltransferase (adenine-specific) n=1 Tax=Tsuneonella litorea TaxID=2976475 RepID=A0A9X2W3R1_9SPHN|nr:N-6 DNA methylase [Tsuneonella litorea]MCT2559151.1 N-6 DNA methylase [Tsuneonella litorea]
MDLVFVADGSFVEAHDLRDGRRLQIDGEDITTLLSERDVLRFLDQGSTIRTPEVVRHTKQELINAFGAANDLLRKEGLREGLERFTEFSNLLFLKLISEIEEDREANGEERILEKRYCWDAFKDKPAQEMLDYINDTVLPRLVRNYNHTSDVFQTKLAITTPKTLKQIVDRLSKLHLLNTESDIKGDAFEYFLKNSISVGNDLGEYFTPRHIVKLAVDLVDPLFEETIYDPTCGTGGFLIQAFRHVKGKVKNTPENLRFLKEDTIFGREITATAKVAKMNMIIIGDGHNNIVQMDSLSKPLKEEYDVVLANFPFSQKTDYAGLYGYETDNANPVFLQLIIDALKPGGRAGVVVPEGVLFDEAAPNVRVRKRLLESCELEAVVSLHEYVFRPYTGQPTSLLIFKKGKPTKSVWFFDVINDGFEKSTRKTGRRAAKENDLPLLRQLWSERGNSDRSFSVGIDTIREHGFKLTIDEFRDQFSNPEWVQLGGQEGVCDIVIGGTPDTSRRDYYGGEHLFAKIGDMTACEGAVLHETEERLTNAGVENSSVKLIGAGTVLLSFKLSLGKVAITGAPMYTNEAIAAIIPKDGRILPKFLYYVLPRIPMPGARKAAKGQTSSKGRLEKARIPLPTIAEQEAFIAKMEEYDETVDRLRREIAETNLEADEWFRAEAMS